MYLHIGGDYLIPIISIVGIFDIEKLEFFNISSENGQFLRKSELNEKVDLISIDIPRSIVVTIEKIYLSPISVYTLLNRI